MFKFDFAVGGGAQHAAELACGDAGGAGPADDAIRAEEVPASEAEPTGSQETLAVSPQLSLFKGVVSNTQAAALLRDERVEGADLVAGVYEGGFKSWEGGVDLAQYVAAALHAQQADAPQADAQQHAAGPAPLRLGPGTRVMELGCGHGLPGLVALWAGAEVHFQDYNRSVLTTLTIPNVQANAAAWAAWRGAAPPPQQQRAEPAARFFAGSWDALPAVLERLGLARSYDLVLTAETIYSPEAMRSLYRCVRACLRPGGTALVAAKTYYFGVGGGTHAFAQLVAADGTHGCCAVALVDDGASNRREILELAPAAAARGAQRQRPDEEEERRRQQ